MKEVLDFLNSIEGAGYGGMASFEIARDRVRECVKRSQPDTEIDRLQADVDRLTAELRAAQEQLTRAKIAMCGVAIGDIVVAKGKRFRVCEIDVNWTTSPPWLKGNALLKDGSWSLAARHLYGDWAKVDQS